MEKLPIERPLFQTWDFDGVLGIAPPPLNTAYELVRRTFILPPLDEPIGEYNARRLKSRVSVILHRYRPVNDVALALPALFKAAGELLGREVKAGLLTGRETDKHELTLDVIRKKGHYEDFDEFMLNMGKSSSGWKEQQVGRLVAEGYNVMHFEDDLKAALRIARNNQDYEDNPRVLVYLIKNLSNLPFLISRAGIILPPNVIPIRSLAVAYADMPTKIKEGKI